MKFKKIFAFVLALAFVVLAGCDTANNEPSETESITDESTSVTETNSEHSGEEASSENVTEEAETTTEFTGEASYILCAYAKDVVDIEDWDESLTPPYETFVADNGENSTKLAFMKNEGGRILDFKLYKLEYVETPSEEIPHFKAEEIYHRKTLSDASPILIQLSFFGTIPSYGISFVDEYGMQSYALSQSGMDGSLILPQIILEGNIEGNAASSLEQYAQTPYFAVNTVKAKPGQKKVAVTVSLKNNPGIASIGLNVEFASGLTLAEIGCNQAMKGQTTQSDITDNSVQLSWVSPLKNHEGDCVFATLYFDVAENAHGEQPVSVSYYPDEVYNLDGECIHFETAAGKITVEE